MDMTFKKGNKVKSIANVTIVKITVTRYKKSDCTKSLYLIGKSRKNQFAMV